MGGRAAFIHASGYSRYCFGAGHPFHPIRLESTLDLLHAYGALDPARLISPPPATDDELRLVHDDAYIAAVQRAGVFGASGIAPGYGLGSRDNPAFADMHEAAALIVGGTLTAMNRVMRGECDHALNLGGGLHHAGRARASGFCVYNDAAVAAMAAVRTYGARVLYIDTDAHHGDGVQDLFYDDPRVMTISLHETGRTLFPGSGWVDEIGRGEAAGTAVNVPLEPYTTDASWLECFAAVVGPLARAFKPDLIISQNGCDAHALDPLAHLATTMCIYREVPRAVHALAHELCAGRWVAVGGGGYEHWRVVPRAWALLWAEMADCDLPEAIPSSWRAKWADAGAPLPETLSDAPVDVAAEALDDALGDAAWAPQDAEHVEINRANALRARALTLAALRHAPRRGA